MMRYLTALVPRWNAQDTDKILRVFDAIPGLTLVESGGRVQRFEFSNIPTEPLNVVYSKYSRDPFFNPFLDCFRKVQGVVSLYSGEDDRIYDLAKEAKLELRAELDKNIPQGCYNGYNPQQLGLHLHVVHASRDRERVFEEVRAWDLILKQKFGARWLDILTGNLK